MKCLRCGAEHDTKRILCPNCAGSHTGAVRSSRAPLANVLSGSHFLYFAIAGLVMIAIYASQRFTPVSIKGLKLNTSYGDTKEVCQAKKGCIAVFLAPWCGACKGHIGLVNNLVNASRNTRLGVEVIVGWSGAEETRSFAGAIKANSFLDPENKFGNKVRFSSVPRWFVINEHQEVTSTFNPSYYSDQTPTQILRFIVEKNAPELLDLLNKS